GLSEKRKRPKLRDQFETRRRRLPPAGGGDRAFLRNAAAPGFERRDARNLRVSGCCAAQQGSGREADGPAVSGFTRPRNCVARQDGPRICENTSRMDRKPRIAAIALAQAALVFAQTASLPTHVPPKRSSQIQNGFGINSDLPRQPYLPWDR